MDIHETPSVVSRTGGHDNAAPATVSDKALTNNASIISTFRIRVDECDRLWVMDTGLADILGSPKQIAPNAIVIFDLNTNQLIKRYPLKPTDLKEGSFIANIVSTCSGSTEHSRFKPDTSADCRRENDEWSSGLRERPRIPPRPGRLRRRRLLTQGR